MSFYCYNDHYTTGSIFLYTWKTGLKLSGWTVPRSSDGTTYNTSGDQITSGSSGTNGLANNRAWFVLRSPSIDGYQRELCIQRSTASNAQWRIKYSFSSGFTGGSPSATQVPSATDEQIILGAGTDASPTFTSILGTDNTYRGIIIIGDSSENYVNYWTSIPSGTISPAGTFIFEIIEQYSKAPQDIERILIGCNTTLLNANNLSNESVGLYTWYKKNLSGESFVLTPMLSLFAGGFFYSGLGSYPINNKEIYLPNIYGRRTALGGNTGIKGIGKYIKTSTNNLSSTSTYDYLSTRDIIKLGSYIFPWDGSVIRV